MTQRTEKPHYHGHRDRLRQRFLSDNGVSMPDYELLELALSIAIPRRDVKPLAKKLMNKYESFTNLMEASDKELREEEKLTDNTILIIKTIKETALRISWPLMQNFENMVIRDIDTVVDYCRKEMMDKEYEEFRIILVNAKLEVIGEEIESRGTFHHVSIQPKEVIKTALKYNAAGIVLVHNHPSGDVKPSLSDIDVTNKIKNAAKQVNLSLLDHIIITTHEYFSFKESYLLDNR